METSVRITMEADVTMDLCSKATMKTKSVSIEGLRSTVQFSARSRRDYTHFAVIREYVVLVSEFYRKY
jgi:ribosomal protein S26